MTFPMAVFDEDAELDQDVDHLIRIALLAEIGLSLEETRAWLREFEARGTRAVS